MCERVSDSATLEQIRREDPAADLVIDPDSFGLLLRETEAPAARGRILRRIVVASVLAAILAFGAASPAIAGAVQRFLSQTGWVGTSPNSPGTDVVKPSADESSTEADHSEWIDVTATDFVPFSVSVFPSEITLPSEYSVDKFASVVATAQKRSFPGAGVIQVTGIQANYESVARCVWIDEWLAAEGSHDVGRATKAAKVLTASATWPATVATDGGGMVEFYTALADAATRGDSAPLVKEQKINCASIPVGVTE